MRRCSLLRDGLSRSVDVPVTVDLEAGYGLEPAELVAALLRIGAAGCNLEDTDHSSESLRDPISRPTGCAAYEKRRMTRTMGW